MSIQLIVPHTVYCGTGELRKIGEIITNHNVKNAVIFTYPTIRENGLLELVEHEIEKAGAEYSVIDNLAVEPTIEQAEETIGKFNELHADMIFAVGGGSVMDVAKLASLMAGSPYTLKELAENPAIGKKKRPTVMIPTTAGTGSEATINSIVTDTERQLKIGIVNEAMVSDYVILAPEMIRNIPQQIAASTGVDALAHVIECYTSKKATRFSDMYALEGIKLIFRYIEEACDPQKRNDEALSAMMLAAFYGGVAITGSGTTAVHALSYPLGGRYHIPHGIANAVLLEPVMRFNMDACEERLEQIYDAVYPQKPIGRREKAEHVIERLGEIVRNLNIPVSVKGYGVREEDLGELVQAGMEVTRLLVNNRKTVTEKDARALYRKIL